MKANYENWDILDNGKPYTYLIYYVGTKNPLALTEDSIKLRQEIWDFKAGKNQYWIRKVIEKTIRDTFDHPEELTLVCMPASNTVDHIKRFKRFSQDLCQALGMSNGFDHLQIIKGHTKTHLGGDLSDGEWGVDRGFFEGKKVILFDDVITKGDHMRFFGGELEKFGATVVGGIFLGHTFFGQTMSTDIVHPLTGTPVFL